MSTFEEIGNLNTKEYAIGTNFQKIEQDLDFLESGGYYTNLLIFLREVSRIPITTRLTDLIIVGIKALKEQIKSQTHNKSVDFYEMIGDIIGEYVRRVDSQDAKSLKDAVDQYYTKSSNILQSSSTSILDFLQVKLNELLSNEDTTILDLLNIFLQDMENIKGDYENVIPRSSILSAMYPHLFDFIHARFLNLVSEESEQEKINQEYEEIKEEIFTSINEMFGDSESRSILLTPLKTLQNLLVSQDIGFVTISTFIDTMGDIFKNILFILSWSGFLSKYVSRMIQFTGFSLSNLLSDLGLSSIVLPTSIINNVLSTRNIVSILFPYVRMENTFKKTLQNHQYIFVDGTAQRPFVTLANTNGKISVNTSFKTFVSFLEGSTSSESENSKYKNDYYLREASIRKPILPFWDFDYPILKIEDIPSAVITPETQYPFVVYLQRYSFYLLKVLLPPVISLIVVSVYDSFRSDRTITEIMFQPFLEEEEEFPSTIEPSISHFLGDIIQNYVDIEPDTALDLRKMSHILYSPILDIFHFLNIPVSFFVMISKWRSGSTPSKDTFDSWIQKLDKISVMKLLYLAFYSSKQTEPSVLQIGDGTLDNPFHLVLQTNSTEYYDILSVERSKHPHSEYLSYITIDTETNGDMGTATLHFDGMSVSDLNKFNQSETLYYYVLGSKKYANSMGYRIGIE